MKRIATIAVAGLSILMASPLAMGQMDKHKHMKHPPRDKRVRGMRGLRMKARSITPTAARPGDSVTIRGRGFRRGTMVMIGNRAISPTSVTRRTITFVVPKMRPGMKPITIRHRAKVIVAGRLRVLRRAGADVKVGTGMGVGRPGRHGRHGRRWRRWRRRPVVNHYFPRRGKPGSRVAIRGRNFSLDAKVFFNGKQIMRTKVTPRRIIFKVPHRVVKGRGLITIRQPGLSKPLIVGMFNVKKRFDRRAAAHRHAELKRHARERWNKHRVALAKTREARMESYRKRWRELRHHRTKRRAKRLTAIRTRWKAAFLSDPQVRAELVLHAERTARLHQMSRLASVDNRGKLAIRINVVLAREEVRHNRRMATLKTAFTVNAGAPR